MGGVGLDGERRRWLRTRWEKSCRGGWRAEAARWWRGWGVEALFTRHLSKLVLISVTQLA